MTSLAWISNTPIIVLVFLLLSILLMVLFVVCFIVGIFSLYHQTRLIAYLMKKHPKKLYEIGFFDVNPFSEKRLEGMFHPIKTFKKFYKDLCSSKDLKLVMLANKSRKHYLPFIKLLIAFGILLLALIILFWVMAIFLALSGVHL